MAAQHVVEARRAQAARDQADAMASIDRKLSLIMAHLGIEDTPQTEPTPAAPVPAKPAGKVGKKQ